MKDFFISYNKADRVWAEWIAWQLEEAKYSVVLQAWDFLGGDNFVLQMQKAVSECKRTIAVLSPDYLVSKFTQPEWAAVFVQDPTGEQRLLLPVIVRKCDLGGMFSAIIHLDLVAKDETSARADLLVFVDPKRKKPGNAPGFPGASRTIQTRPRFPGAFPPIWNVPHRRNPLFTGREEELQKLRKTLVSGKLGALTNALFGLGGVGKTQIAIEYVFRYHSEYSLIWWVRSEDPETLAADFAALSGPLKLLENDSLDQSERISAVLKYLRHNVGWLLVFDNAVDDKSIAAYLPGTESCHVIITSRNPYWKNIGRGLDVKVFDRRSSIELLLKRGGQRDEKGANELAEELGDLPLAIEQAGAFVERTGMPVGVYLGLFKERGLDLLKQGFAGEKDQRTVSTTWSLSIEKVGQTSLAAVVILELSAFFAPDDIPLDVFRDSWKVLSIEMGDLFADDLKFGEALSLIFGFSIATGGYSSMNMHRLVQSVIRNSISREQRDMIFVSIGTLMLTRFGETALQNPATWKQCNRLVPHLTHLLVLPEMATHFSVEMSQLLNHAGAFLRIQGQVSNSLAFAERSLEMALVVLGENDRNTAVCYNNLGLSWSGLGQIEKAVECFQKSLAIDLKLFGGEHPETAVDYNNLGMTYSELENYEAAKEYFEKSLSITRETQGATSEGVAIITSNLGTVWCELGEYGKACECYQLAIGIEKKLFGDIHPNLANRYNNLGNALGRLGRTEEAINYFELALAIIEEIFGPDHFFAATTFSNLGGAFLALGEIQEAIHYFKQALQIDLKFLGSEHPTLVLRYSSLAGAYRVVGERGKVLEYMNQACAISRIVHGPHHPTTQKLQTKLSDYLSEGQ